jgi:hypothetical protein
LTKKVGVLICFPPGAGGSFVASLVKHLQSGHSVKLSALGHAHNNNIPWVSNLLNARGFSADLENFCFELFEIQQMGDHQIALCHFRNINKCMQHAEKVIYIDFDFASIDIIQKKAEFKNQIEILPEQDYDRIKGENWPSYEQFVQGQVVPELWQHVRSPLYDWYWVLPKNTNNNLHRVCFENIFGIDPNWIHELGKFLQTPVTDSALELWNTYKSSQIV